MGEPNLNKTNRFASRLSHTMRQSYVFCMMQLSWFWQKLLANYCKAKRYICLLHKNGTMVPWHWRWRDQLWVWGLISQLFASGFLGAIMWPPPSMKAYETLLEITKVSGPYGCLIRMGIGLLAISAWMMPFWFWRVFTYSLATMCAALLTISFFDTGQGFATGSWAVSTFTGIVALAKLKRQSCSISNLPDL